MPSTNALGALLGHQRSVVAGVKFAFITWGIRAGHGGRLVRGRAAFGAMNTRRDGGGERTAGKVRAAACRYRLAVQVRYGTWPVAWSR
jgi:hypothetical protein